MTCLLIKLPESIKRNVVGQAVTTNTTLLTISRNFIFALNLRDKIIPKLGSKKGEMFSD